MRLFVAINFNDDVKANLFLTLEQLKRQSASGKFTAIDNMHLTLAFLGEIPEKQVKVIKQIFHKINSKSFPIIINGFGDFKIRGEKLYWRGIEESNELLDLQQQIVKELKVEGFTLDDKPFKPHITLGRRCVMKKGFSPEMFSGNLSPISMTVDQISLMESQRINGKLLYTERLVHHLD